MKTEYQKPFWEIVIFEDTPRTIIEASEEFTGGEDIEAYGEGSLGF